MADRQAGTLATRPGETHFLIMAKNWLFTGKFEGLLFHAMWGEQCSSAMRSSEVRELQLADRQIYLYSSVRPATATAVISLKQNGKTNQVGCNTSTPLSWHTSIDSCSVRHTTTDACSVQHNNTESCCITHNS